MKYEFSITDINDAYGRCWFGSQHPNEVRGSRETVQEFKRYMRTQGFTGDCIYAARLVVVEGMQDGILHFVNTSFPQDKRLNIVISVEKWEDPGATPRARGEGA